MSKIEPIAGCPLCGKKFYQDTESKCGGMVDGRPWCDESILSNELSKIKEQKDAV